MGIKVAGILIVQCITPLRYFCHVLPCRSYQLAFHPLFAYHKWKVNFLMCSNPYPNSYTLVVVFYPLTSYGKVCAAYVSVLIYISH